MLNKLIINLNPHITVNLFYCNKLQRWIEFFCCHHKEKEKESKSVGLEKEDALNQARWRVGVEEIAVGVG